MIVEQTVWADLVGQDKAIAAFQRAVDAAHGGESAKAAMSHAWLITGPAGSGRSNAAIAFAAGLQCAKGGCGSCQQCQMVLGQVHPDVSVVRTEKLSIGVDEVRELVRKSVLAPSGNSFQVIVVEDADRITVEGANALLKGVEEPAAKTVWLLCAPTADDVVITIRSRCREQRLVSPPIDGVAELLVRRDGISAEKAAWAARVCQGHIGLARRLATDESASQYREQILSIPARLNSLAGCLEAADDLVKYAKTAAEERSAKLDTKEREELLSSMQALDAKGKKSTASGSAGALKDLEKAQKLRATRFSRDVLDRALTDLSTWYRDLLVIQLTGDTQRVVNVDRADQLEKLAGRWPADRTLGMIDEILACRQALEQNVAPLLAVENLMVSLGQGSFA